MRGNNDNDSDRNKGIQHTEIYMSMHIGTRNSDSDSNSDKFPTLEFCVYRLIVY